MSQDQSAAVTLAASGDGTVATIRVGDKKLLCFHFDVITQALDNFDVLAKAHDGATAQDLTPADWTALVPGKRFLHSSGNLAAVAASGNGYLEMDVTGLAEVTVKASAAVDGAVVTPRWSLT